MMMKTNDDIDYDHDEYYDDYGLRTGGEKIIA